MNRRKRTPTTELVPRDRDAQCGPCQRCSAPGQGDDHSTVVECLAYWRKRTTAAEREVLRLETDVARLQRMLGRKRGEPSKIEELAQIVSALQERIDHFEHARDRLLEDAIQENERIRALFEHTKPISRSGKI